MSEKEMILGLLGRKLRMTQIFQEDGTLIPVTALHVGPCHVLSICTPDKDGYAALQLGFGKKKKVKVPQKKFYDKIGVPGQAFVREIEVGGTEVLEKIEPGREIGLDIFEGVEKVDVVGTSKGRGFAGCIKRHNFSRGSMTHGCKNVREPGSTGCSAYPGRTFKNKKMAGQLGNKRTTVRNLKVVKLDKENNVMYVKGAVPGPRGGYIIINKNIDERNKWAPALSGSASK